MRSGAAHPCMSLCTVEACCGQLWWGERSEWTSLSTGRPLAAVTVTVSVQSGSR